MAIYLINYGLILYAFVLSKLFRFTEHTKYVFYLITLVYFTWFIGLRHEVGGDWETYLLHLESLESLSLDVLLFWNPGYVFIEYVSKFLGLGIYGVNTICAIIFMANFLYFVRTLRLNLPFSLLIAYPYLIMVVAMGYTRQAVALGFIFGFVASLYKEKIKQSSIFLLTALLFHESALIASISYLRYIVNFMSIKRTAFFFAIFLICFLVLYYIYSERVYFLLHSYFLEKMESAGAIIRIFLNLLSGIFLVIFYHKWRKIFRDFTFWVPFAVISVFLLFFATIIGATTMADRLMLYFYPLQVVVFTRLQYLIPYNFLKATYIFSVIILYLAVLLVWLFFAVHRDSWIPYNNLLFLLLSL